MNHTPMEVMLDEQVERLKAINAELLEALEIARGSVQWMAEATDADPEDHERLAVVNEAIRKAKE